jgi:hypothetical protein
MLKMTSDHLWRNAMANSKDVVVTGVSIGIGWGTTTVLVSKGFRVFRMADGPTRGFGLRLIRVYLPTLLLV